MTNALNWFDIPVSDMERAAKFYSEILGVSLERYRALGHPHPGNPDTDLSSRQEYCSIPKYLELLTMIGNKKQVLTRLKEEFDRWEELLANLSDEQVASSRLRNGWTIKDLMAHLMAWQQVTVARLEAARRNEEPVFPVWFAEEDPESEDVDRFNARIYQTYRDQLWPQAHQGWRDGFRNVLKLGEETPEQDLVDAGKYPWLKGYPLITVLQGIYEHHHNDHLEPFLDWIRQHREP